VCQLDCKAYSEMIDHDCTCAQDSLAYDLDCAK